MRFTSLSDWLKWQETCHPTEIDLGLDRVLAVYQSLADRPIARHVITVAGTNGKGSSICFLDSILRSAGYQVGCYTSPHLFSYNERIRLNGIPVSDEDLCDVFDKIDKARADISLSYFEFGTIAALLLMAAQNLDIAILEVGLGGRLDAVNIIDADIALITAIDIDHEFWLGSDREKIAIEKAGIMRSSKPIVCSDFHAPQAIFNCASLINATLYSINRDFNFSVNESSWDWIGLSETRYSLPFLPLKGSHQYNNMSGVLMVLALLDPEYPVSQNQLRDGILSSSIAGRLERIPGHINTIIDVAHNAQASHVLSHYLNENRCTGDVRIVTGIMSDKNIAAIVAPFTDWIHSWYVTDLQVDRAIPAQQMIAIIKQKNADSRCFAYSNAKQAYLQACHDSQDNDQIVVFGSFHLLHALQSELDMTRELT